MLQLKTSSRYPTVSSCCRLKAGLRVECAWAAFTLMIPSRWSQSQTFSNGMAVSESPGVVNYSECVVCGKFVRQIQLEAFSEYLNKTVVPGETLAEREARRRAFLYGMSAGTFLLTLGGVSQAAACNGNWYSISYNHYNTLPGQSRLTEEIGHAVQKELY